MKTMKPLILTAALAALAIGSAQAQIFTDTTGFTNWYKGAVPGTLTKGVNDLVWTEGGNNNEEVIHRLFTDTTLTVGQTMRFTLDWTQSGGSSSIVRMGLSDANPDTGGNGDVTADADGYTGSGYYSFIRDNSASASSARYETMTNYTALTGSNETFANNTAVFDLVDNGTKTYNLIFDVTYTSLTRVDTAFKIFDGVTEVYSVTGNTTANIVNKFDVASFRVSGGTATLDNLQVAVIPEPSTFALLAGGLATLVVFRRRRRI